jgi:nitrate/nitrite transporter NarK
MGLATYLVVYLWREIGFSEAAAGLVFAGLHIAGISARIVLGLLADRVTSARRILTLLCVVLAVSLLLSSLFTQHWPLVFVYAVIFVAGGSGNGWVGLYYAELARLTPVDQVAEITGASQFFTYIGLLSGPVLFAALLAATDSFRVTLIVFAVMIAMVAFSLVRSSAGNGHEE